MLIKLGGYVEEKKSRPDGMSFSDAQFREALKARLAELVPDVGERAVLIANADEDEPTDEWKSPLPHRAA
jgi:hypothetical protein